MCRYQHDAYKPLEAGSAQTFKGTRQFRQKHLSYSGDKFSKVTQNQITRPYEVGKVNIKNIFETGDVSVESLEDKELQEEDVAPHIILDSVSMTEFQSKLTDCDDLVYSHEDWEKLQKETLSEKPNLKKSWETVCMQLMYHHGHTHLASSFLGFLKKEATSPKIATLCLFVALQGKHGTEKKEKIIQETFQEILKMTDVFDSITAKYLIGGLSYTSQWRKTLDILEIAKLTATLGRPYYSPIIAAAIRDQDTHLAFELLDELTLNGFEPQDVVLQEILRACENAGSHDLLERYFTHMWNYSWRLPLSVTKDLELYFTRSAREKWTCKWTSVNTVRGVCHQCRQGLDRVELSTSDFEALQREFLERALVGSNVYLQSNPQEVERFRDFVMENAPFDVVLDALNIAFKGQGRNSVRKSKQLRDMVHYFARERHMKVLVIGRAHMERWSAADMGYIGRQAKVFYTDNISSDDPFCLYSTLYSGKDCLFVSGDFMRNHKYSLGPRFKGIFERWQKSRQIVNFVSQEDGVSVVMPSQFDCGPIKDGKGWHIPYSDGTVDLRSGSQTVLCLRYKGQRKSSKHSKKDD
ncbi:hypothetical protein ACOMHN_034298 [Nucella lapillus]